MGRAPKKTAVISWAPLAAAVFLPVAAAGFGIISPGRAGYIAGALSVCLLLAVGVCFAIPVWTRLLVGGIFVAWAATLVFSARREGQAHEAGLEKTLARELIAAMNSANTARDEVAQTAPTPAASGETGTAPFTSITGLTSREATFLEGSLDIEKRLIAQSARLQSEFAEVDMSTVLRPERLTEAAGIRASRGSLEHFVSLVDQRDALLDRYSKDMAEYFHTADIDEENREAAIENFEKAMPRTSRAFHDLSDAQRASVSSASDVLDFAEANLGKIATRNGQLLFHDQVSLDRYRLLLARVQAAAQRETEATKSARAFSASSLQLLQRKANGG